MKSKILFHITVFIQIFMGLSSHADGGLLTYFHDSTDWFESQGMGLGFKGIHGQEIPLRIEQTQEHHLANIGTGWRLHIPYIQLKDSKRRESSQTSSSSEMYTSTLQGRLVPNGNSNQWVPVVQQDNKEEVWHKIEENGETVGFIYHNQARPREVWVFKEIMRNDLGQPVMWFLSKIIHGFGEELTFQYAKSHTSLANHQLAVQGFPILTAVVSDKQNIQLNFQYIPKAISPFTTHWGVPIGETKDLTHISIFHQKQKKVLGSIQFFYAKSSWQNNKLRHLKFVDMVDYMAPNHIPKRKIEICNLALCRSSSDPEWAIEKITLSQAQNEAISQDRAQIGIHPQTALPVLISLPPVADAAVKKALENEKIQLFESTVDRNGIRKLFHGRERAFKFSNTFLPVFNKEIPWGVREPFGNVLTLWHEKDHKIVEHTVPLLTDSHLSPALDLVATQNPAVELKKSSRYTHSLLVDTNGDGIKEWVELQRHDPLNPRSVKIKIWHRNKNGMLFHNPVESTVTIPQSYPLSHLVFFDANNDGFVDILQLPFMDSHISSRSPVYFFENKAGHGFIDGRPLKGPTHLLPALGKQGHSWVVDTRASGRNDLVFFDNGSLFVVSPDTAPQRSDALVSLKHNHGLEKKLTYAPLSSFYNQAPLGIGHENVFKPSISRGATVVAFTENKDSITHESRLKSKRYFGPTYQFDENEFLGFQVLEEKHHGTGLNSTITHQVTRQFKANGLLWDWGIKSINTYDGKDQLVQREIYKPLIIEHKPIMGLDNPPPLPGVGGEGFSKEFNHPYRKLVTSKITHNYFGTDNRTTSVMFYSFDLPKSQKTEKEKHKEITDGFIKLNLNDFDPRWKSRDDGRSIKQVFYAPPFSWAYGGQTFFDKSLINRELLIDSSGEILRDERAHYDLRNGLRTSHTICGDRDCHPNTSATTLTTYNPLGFPQSIVRPRGSEIHYSFDKAHPHIVRGVIESGPDIPTRFTRILKLDALMEPCEEQTPQGDIRKTLRSGLGYIISQTLGTTVTHQHIDLGQRKLISLVNPRYGNEKKRETVETFNAFGEVVQSTLQGVKTNFFKYDNLGRIVAQSIDLPEDFSTPNPNKQPHLFHFSEFDTLGRKIKTRDSGGRAETHYSFGPQGVTVTEISHTPVDKKRTAHFDINAWGEVIGFTNARGGHYALKRNGLGQITQLQIPHGVTRHFTYDATGRTTLIEESVGTPASKRTLRQFFYGVDENAEKVIGPEGPCSDNQAHRSCREARLSYDSLGRLVKRIALSGKAESLQKSITTIGFDKPKGNPNAQIHDPNQALGQPTWVQVAWEGGHINRRYFYNKQGLLAEIQQNLNGGFVHTLQRLYNGFGEQVSLIYPDGFQTFSERDTAGRVIAVKAHEVGSRHTQTLARYRNFTPFGVAQEVWLGGGIVRRTLFQGLLPVVSALSLSGANAQQHFESKYTFDGFGNLVVAQESVGHFEFQYDDLDQLTTAKGPFGDRNVLNYTFDESGRGLSFAGKRIHYDNQTDPYRPSHVTTDSGTPLWLYNYTRAGQQKTRVSFKNGMPDISQRLVWDANGLLEGVWEDPTGGTNYEPVQFMAYDERQEKVASVDAFGHSTQYMGKLFESSSFGTVRHVFGGQRERLATFITSTPHKSLASLRSKPSFHSALAGLLHPVSYLNTVAQERNRLIFLHTDALGQLRFTTNHKGIVLEKHHFEPFGERVAQPGQTIVPERPRSAIRGGLQAMGVRLYDSVVGQFVSRDPHFAVNVALGGEALELGLYNYARNNPLKYNDPSGEFATPLGAVNASLYLASQSIRSDINSLTWQQAMGIGARAVIMLNPIADIAYRAGSATLGKDLLTGESTSIPSYILGTAVDYTIGKAVQKVLNTAVNGYFNWQWLSPSKGVSKTSGLTNTIEKNASPLQKPLNPHSQVIKLHDGRTLDLNRHKIRTSQHYDRAFVEPKGHHIHQKHVFEDWNNFLGPNQTNISPFTRKVSPDRIWSMDGTRSIRMGPHEMTRDLHYHKETWFDKLVVNEMKRVFTTVD